MPKIALLPLISHLQACPPDFFRPAQSPYSQWSRLIPALLHDFLAVHHPNTELNTQLKIRELLSQPAQAEWLPPLCWLLSHPLFNTVLNLEQILPLLLSLAQRLGTGFPPHEVLYQTQRAEECLRELLSSLKWAIENETPEQSATKLHYLSSLQKQQRAHLRQQKRQRESAILQAKHRLQAMDNSD